MGAFVGLGAGVASFYLGGLVGAQDDGYGLEDGDVLADYLDDDGHGHGQDEAREAPEPAPGEQGADYDEGRESQVLALQLGFDEVS